MGECVFWYRLTRVVPDKSRKTVVVVVVVVVVTAATREYGVTPTTFSFIAANSQPVVDLHSRICMLLATTALIAVAHELPAS